MSKSTIIVVALLWIICSVYYTLARTNDLPLAQAAMVGTWIASALLLICIVIYVKKHGGK